MKTSSKHQEPLNPKLLSFCSKLVTANPAAKKKVTEAINYLKECRKKDEFFSNPPYAWSPESWEKNSISFSNGLFLVEVKQTKNGKVLLSSEADHLNHSLKFPIPQTTEQYDDLFFALAQAHYLMEELDQKYLGEE